MVGHGQDVDDRSVRALEDRTHEVLDAAFAAGVPHFDAARSYGRAEEFLSSWLRSRAIEPGAVAVSSQWDIEPTKRVAGDCRYAWRSDHLADARSETSEFSSRASATTVPVLGAKADVGPDLLSPSPQRDAPARGRTALLPRRDRLQAGASLREAVREQPGQ